MHLRLTDRAIRETYRELSDADGPITGRQLRRALKARFHAVGKTERIFRIWREEGANCSLATLPATGDPAALLIRLQAAEGSAEEWRRRAESAEAREEAHQDRWAGEIDKLRQSLQALPGYAAEIRILQERVLRLSAELHAARCLLADLDNRP